MVEVLSSSPYNDVGPDSATTEATTSDSVWILNYEQMFISYF